jgi:hypothetical protein
LFAKTLFWRKTVKKKLFAAAALMALAALPAAAQDAVPAVTVGNQFVTEYVYVQDVVSNGPGFVVIHQNNADNPGSPGPVAGFASVASGYTPAVWIAVDPDLVTSTMFAMLHTDDNTVGEYEFGTVEGADAPVAVDGNVVTPAFQVAAIHAHGQFVVDNTVTIHAVTTDADGWLVIHSDNPENPGRPGPVLGQTLISAGTTNDVVVELTAGAATNVLWPMIHVDTGEIGVYEFGTVEGADAPVVYNVVAVTDFTTVPDIDVDPQVLVAGDGMEGMLAADLTFAADSVLAAEQGWLVIHQDNPDNPGNPGPVVGFAPVAAGLNEDVVVELDESLITPVLFPMLHVDTGTVGEYEFGTVEGADGPVRVGENVVTFPVNVGPTITALDQELTTRGEETGVMIRFVQIDEPGWVVIHMDNPENPGSPGPVIGQAYLPQGWWNNLFVPVDAAQAGALVFPMLHYDTGTAGTYEFGTVEGADSPVSVGGNVVVVPVAITTP